MLAAAGCDRGEPRPLPGYAAPARRPAQGDPSCEGVAASWPEARWVEGALSLRVGPGSRVEIADASVLGGPYEEPITFEVPPGLYPISLVVGRVASGQPSPLCARVRLGDAKAASWRALGDVALDSDVLVLADGAAWRRSLGARTAGLYAALEADAPALETIGRELAAKGLPLAPVLPTLARANRPLAPGDERLVRGAIAGARARARFLIEPASPGGEVLSRMGEADYAELSFEPEAPQSAVAIAAGRGTGAYAVAAGYGPAGEPVALEVRLAP